MKRLALLGLLLTLASCGRPPRRAPADSPPQLVLLPPEETPLHLTQAWVYPAGLPEVTGIATDGEDRICLVGGEQVRVLAGDGQELHRWSLPTPGRGVALDPDGQVWVGLGDAVASFSLAGKPLGRWGAPGRERGQLGVVTDLALRGMNVLVADAGNRCIHRFDRRGDLIETIGAREPELGRLGLICPSPYLGLDLDADGVLHVTNPGLLRVERYRLDGELLGHWGEPGVAPERFPGCCNPIDLVLLPEDRIAVAEKAPSRVKVYDLEGRLLAYLGPEHFDDEPLLLAADTRGRLHVASSTTIHVYKCK